MCAHHSAMFRFEDGVCIDGPCQGAALTPVPFVSNKDKYSTTTDGDRSEEDGIGTSRWAAAKKAIFELTSQFDLGSGATIPGAGQLAITCLIRLESIPFEDRKSFRRADEVQPALRRSACGACAFDGARIDRRRVVGRRNVHMTDGMAGLFLEHRFRLPCDACLRLALHDPQWRLPVMDVRQHGRTIGDLVP